MKKILLIIVIIIAILTIAGMLLINWLNTCPEGQVLKQGSCSCKYSCVEKAQATTNDDGKIEFTGLDTATCARFCGTPMIKINFSKLENLFGN